MPRLTFALLFLAGAAWSLSTPLMSGADESDHAIRAAAAARGQLLGGDTQDLLGARNVFIEVEVPEAYGDARAVATCFLDTRDSPAPNASPFGELGPPPPCEPMEGGRRLVTTTTLQYRGQPTYYVLVGLPSLVWPDGTGVTMMRLASAALVAALLASALAAARRLPDGRLGSLAVLAGTTPVCLWLAGQVNSGGSEIAAALLLWTGGMGLVRAPEVTGRDVARVGAAFCVLSLWRGLSPAFSVGALVVVALVGDRERLRALAGRRDVRRWAVAGAACWLASVAWLAAVQIGFPLDPRPGSGLSTALGDGDWYLRQTVGVFGVNDIVLPGPAVAAWLAVVAGLVGVGLGRATGRVRLVVGLLAAGSFALNVTAEGLSFPPIGYYWQGRYVLPLLVGVAIVAVAGPGRGASDPVRLPAVAVPVAAGLLVAVHVWAFAHAARHLAGQGQGDIGFADALADPVWRPPLLPAWAWTLVYGASVAATAAVALSGPRAQRLRGRHGAAGAPPPTVDRLGSPDHASRP